MNAGDALGTANAHAFQKKCEDAHGFVEGSRISSNGRVCSSVEVLRHWLQR